MKRKRVASPLTMVSWTAFSAVLLWLLLFVLTGEQFTIVRWISYVAPWLAGGLLLLVVAAAFFRKKKLVISMFILAMLISYPYMHLFFPSQAKVVAGQNIYKVMTYSKMGRNHDMDAVARVVASEKPDILFMQETSKAQAQQLFDLIMPAYNSQLFWQGGGHYGLILSRYAITSRLQKRDLSLSVDIALPDGIVRAWNVHLQKSFGSTGLQYKMVEQLAHQSALIHGPVIVAGDFNATVINYPYVIMKWHLDNAFEQAGFGFGFTFPSPARRMGLLAPFMRIDHIFYSKQFLVHEAYVVDDAGGSDHYPVVALLSLKQSGAR